MNKLKELVGTIQDNPSEHWQGLNGIDFIVFQLQEDAKELLVIRPIKLEDMEKFYKSSYDTGMKEMISDDYDYCIWYLLNEDCELTCVIDKDDLVSIREITEDDLNEHNKNLDEFKKIHKVYEYQKKLEEEELQEEIAIKEFEKEEKVKFPITLKYKEDIKVVEVDAVIYKNFAIHKNIGDIGSSSYKAISIIDGEFKGMQLTTSSVANYKKLIDEIREEIGDRALTNADTEMLQSIVMKY